jgi:replicative DNA helicase
MTGDMIVQQVPYSQEAEEAVLGAMLMDPAAVRQVAELLRPTDFFFLRHGAIYEAMLALDARGLPPDLIALADDLRARGMEAETGGAPYLLQLANATPTSRNVEVYAHLVARAAIRRRMLQAADAIRGAALDESIPVEAALDTADAALVAVARPQAAWRSSIRDALHRHAEMVEQRMNEGQAFIGIPSALPRLNALLGGYMAGKVYLVAARPGMGKSSLLTTEAAYACRMGRRALFVTLEIGEEELTTNLIAGYTGIDTRRIERGHMDQETHQKYIQGLIDIGNWELTIDSSPSMTPLALRNIARRLRHQHGLDAIYIDYVQLMSAEEGALRKSAQREQEVGHVSRSLKQIAKELQVPVIAAAQLNRAADNRGDKRPTLADLRESGTLEQDADVVMLLYRDDYYNPPVVRPPAGAPSRTEIIIGKNRGGEGAGTTVLADLYLSVRRFHGVDRI